MRIVFDGRTLRGVPGSLTRRQLLVRTGGASVALVCFGALPGGAVADPAALSSARAATYAALLDAINADPALRAGRTASSSSPASPTATPATTSLRAYADAVLDAIERRLARVSPDAAHDALATLGRARSSRTP